MGKKSLTVEFPNYSARISYCNFILILLFSYLLIGRMYAQERPFDLLLSSTNAPDQRLVGIAYLTGNPVPQNFQLAFKSLAAASAQGDQMAQWWLAQCYEQGKGIPANEAAADRIYLKLCNEGFTNAQASLGLKLSSRYIQHRDPTTGIQAYKWLALVAATDKIYADSRDSIAEELPKPTLTFAQNLVITFQPTTPSPLILTNFFRTKASK